LSYLLPQESSSSKKMVQVGIEGKQVRSSSNTPSFAARAHESHPAIVKAGCKVNLDVICIIPSKSKEPSKLLKGDLIPSPLSHPIEIPRASLFNIQGGIELSNYLIVPILLNRHDIPKCLALQAATTSSKIVSCFASTSSSSELLLALGLGSSLIVMSPLGRSCRLVVLLTPFRR
jgi:hypothetical protein